MFLQEECCFNRIKHDQHINCESCVVHIHIVIHSTQTYERIGYIIIMFKILILFNPKTSFFRIDSKRLFRFLLLDVNCN